MQIKSLSLRDFRNHQEAQFTFGPGVTAVIGRNGRGKTNIVEAVNYFATLGSHRVSQDTPLIRWGCEEAHITALVQKYERQATVGITLRASGSNKVTLNENKLSKPRDLLGLVHTVIFAPEDLELVRREPAARRKYIDDFCTQLTPRYAGLRIDYERTLKQRNSLLKSHGRREMSANALATLQAWDEQLISYGSQLVHQRLMALNQLKEPIDLHGKMLSGDTEPLLTTYQSRWLTTDHTDIDALQEDFRKALAERHREEVERGVTLVGPHRDDIELTLSGMPAKEYSSHGQSWSVALALRLATFTILRQHDDDPILILDDVFAELDRKRRTRLVSAVSGVEQVLITAAVLEDVPSELQSYQMVLD
jgi:DNA replication and repair protein RecF